MSKKDKDFDWDQFEQVKPNSSFDWSEFEDVGNPATPPEDSYTNSPAWVRALNSFNSSAIPVGLRTGVERTTQGILQALLPNNQALKDLAGERERNYAQAYETSPASALFGNILGGVGASLPTALVGGAVTSRALPVVGPLAANALGAATEGGLFGASQYVNEGESRLGNARKDALLGGLLSGAIGGATKGTKGLLNQFSPSAESIAAKANPNLPIEELLARQRAAKGTLTPIGDVIGSSELKKQFENKLVPGFNSKGAEKLTSLEGQIINKSENILNKVGSKYAGENTDELTKNLLTKAFDKQSKAKNKLYESVNKLADNEKFALNLPNFSKTAANSIEALQESLVAKADPKLKQLLNRVKALESGAESIGDVSLKDAQILSGSLASDAQKFASSSATSDRYTSGLLNNLSKALRKDIKEEVSSRGSTALKDALGSANANYKEKYSGFLDKDIYRFLNQNKDADAIVREIVRPSTTLDKSSRIKKIQNLLPEEDRNLMGFALLNKATNINGMLDPRKVSNILNGLGDKQFKALFPDETLRTELRDLQKLYSMNPEALNNMFNPKTGARSVDATDLLKEFAKAGAAGKAFGPIGVGVSAGTTAARNRILTDKFTNEAFRNQVVDKVVKKTTTTPKAPNNDFMKAMEVWLNDNRRDK